MRLSMSERAGSWLWRWFSVLAGLAGIVAPVCNVGAAETVRPASHALIVVVPEFADCPELTPLSGGMAEAERMRTALIRGGFDSKNIRVLGEGLGADQRPTRDYVRAELNAFVNRLRDGDTALIAATSHGFSFNGVSYFCPSDTTSEGIADAAGAKKQLIAVQELTDKLAKSKAANRLVVLDACRDASRGDRHGFVETLRKPPEGVWLMTSCSEGQNSYVSTRLPDRAPHALFSYFLCEGIAGQADLTGSMNGRVSVLELFSYAYVRTRGAAEELGEIQTPELFCGLAAPFDVVDVTTLVPPREIVSNDPRREQEYTAALIADEAFQSQRFYADKHRRNYQLVAQGQVAFDQRAIEVKYRDELCVLLGNSIRKSLELDPNCRLAHLVRGQCYRTCGQYREALEDFRVAGEPLELFVRGSYEDLSRYLNAVDDIGITMRGRALSDVAKVNLKPLYAEAATSSRVVGRIAAHSKIRVEQVASNAVDGDGQFLLVTAVNDQPLATPAWIRADEAHWLAEAADVYQPATPMGGRRTNGLPPALARLDEISHNLNAIADRLSEPSVRIHNLADRIRGARLGQASDRINRIAGFLGVSVPTNPAPAFIDRLAGYAAIPSNYVHTASGYAQMPVQVGVAIRGWSGVAADYRDSLALDAKASTERRQLLSAGLLSPLSPRIAKVERSPWLAAATLHASSEVAQAK